MKKTRFFCLVCLCLVLCACEYTRDGDSDYKPSDYTLPSVSTAEKDSVPYAAAKLIAAGQVVRDYYEVTADIDGIEQAYTIRTNGLNVQIYKLREDSELLAQMREMGAYPLKDEDGNVLSTRRAGINGHFVLMIPSDTNAKGEDVTELNDRLVKRFEELKL